MRARRPERSPGEPDPIPASSTFDALTRVAYFLLHFRAADGFSVASKRALECRHRIRVAFLLEPQIAEVFVHRRAHGQLLGRLRQCRIRQIQLALTEISPAQAV